MSIDPSEVYERFRKAGNDWAILNGLASLLEERRKPVRALIMVSYGEMSVNKAEMLAEADEKYMSHIEKMVKARTEADKARADYDAIKAWVELVRSAESTRREEMKLVRG